jgi:hypothetical protein
MNFVSREKNVSEILLQTVKRERKKEMAQNEKRKK